DGGVLASVRHDNVVRRVRPLRQPARSGVRSESTRSPRKHRHRGLRNLMDLRDFEPARESRRLSGAAAQSPALVDRLLFACVLVQLGVMSLAWTLVAPLLALVLPRAVGGRLGRAFISFVYRRCW